MIDRVFAAVLFVVTYIGALILATQLNRSVITTRTIAGPEVASVVYAVVFLPAGIAAVGILLVAKCSRRLRIVLALGFASAIGAVVYTFFALQSQRPGEALGQADLVLFAVLNLIVIAAFTAVFAVVRWKARTAPNRLSNSA